VRRGRRGRWPPRCARDQQLCFTDWLDAAGVYAPTNTNATDDKGTPPPVAMDTYVGEFATLAGTPPGSPPPSLPPSPPESEAGGDDPVEEAEAEAEPPARFRVRPWPVVLGGARDLRAKRATHDPVDLDGGGCSSFAAMQDSLEMSEHGLKGLFNDVRWRRAMWHYRAGSGTSDNFVSLEAVGDWLALRDDMRDNHEWGLRPYEAERCLLEWLMEHHLASLTVLLDEGHVHLGNDLFEPCTMEWQSFSGGEPESLLAMAARHVCSPAAVRLLLARGADPNAELVHLSFNGAMLPTCGPGGLAWNDVRNHWLGAGAAADATRAEILTALAEAGGEMFDAWDAYERHEGYEGERDLCDKLFNVETKRREGYLRQCLETIVAAVGIVSFWRRAAAAPDSKAGKAAIARAAAAATGMAGSGAPPPSLPPSPPSSEAGDDPMEDADTADMAPVGDGDFTIGPRDWPGTYLAWLNDDLLVKLFGSLQLLCALEWVRFKVGGRIDHPNPARALVDVRGNVPDRDGEDLMVRYFRPIKAGATDKRDNRGYIHPYAQLTPALVAHFRDSPERSRRRTYRHKKRKAFEQIQWFSDALLRSRCMDALPRLYPYYRINYARIPDACGGGERAYDWADRAKWPSARLGAVWMERLGLSFELPQQRWLGADGHRTQYGAEMHALRAAEGRARTTDLLDALEAYQLRSAARREWGRTYADAFQSRRAPGTLSGHVTADGVAHADANAARGHELKLEREAERRAREEEEALPPPSLPPSPPASEM